MTFTYDATAEQTDLQWVREAIGDTDATEAFLPDEVILRAVDTYGRERGAVVSARRILASFARYMSKSGGRGVNLQWRERFENYKALVELLESEIAVGATAAVPWAVVSDAAENELPGPIFTRHMHERRGPDEQDVYK